MLTKISINLCLKKQGNPVSDKVTTLAKLEAAALFNISAWSKIRKKKIRKLNYMFFKFSEKILYIYILFKKIKYLFFEIQGDNLKTTKTNCLVTSHLWTNFSNFYRTYSPDTKVFLCQKILANRQQVQWENALEHKSYFLKQITFLQQRHSLIWKRSHTAMLLIPLKLIGTYKRKHFENRLTNKFTVPKT